MQTIKLNVGVAIPQIGFGTFQIPAGAETGKAVAYALSCGCRHIDTAAAYFNEADVGRGGEGRHGGRPSHAWAQAAIEELSSIDA